MAWLIRDGDEAYAVVVGANDSAGEIDLRALQSAGRAAGRLVLGAGDG